MPEPSPMNLGYEHNERKVDEDALVDELASSGWLRAYLSWASGQTDAPRLFHLGTALNVLGSSLGNRVRCPAWGQDVYPHLWICLLAPSGFYRKTTSSRMGARLLRDADITPQDSAGILLPKDFSREKLITYLATRPDGLLVQDEFAEFLAKLGRDYNAGAKELLTGLFDGDVYDRITGAGGHVIIREPAISILTASTIDWINERVTGGDLRGGFFSRFLFLSAQQKGEWKGLGDGVDSGHSPVREGLLDGLRERMKVAGLADFRGVRREYNEWLKQFESDTNISHDPKIIGFLSRAGLYVMKLAICFEVGEHPLAIQGEGAYRRLPIRLTSLTKAIRFWDFLVGNISELMSERIATNWTERNLLKLLDAIDANNGEPVKASDILRATRMTERDHKTYIQTLLASEQIEQVNVPQKGPGRRAAYYRRKRRIISQQASGNGVNSPIELPPLGGKNSVNSTVGVVETPPLGHNTIEEVPF